MKALAPPGAKAMGNDDLCARLAALSLDEALKVLLERLMQASGATGAALGWAEQGQVRLAASSSRPAAGDGPVQHHLAPASTPLVEAAMEEAIDQGVVLASATHPASPAPWVILAQQALAADRHEAILTMPLPGGPAPLGALCLMWPDEAHRSLAPDVSALQTLLAGAAAVIALQRQLAQPWHWHARQAVLRRWTRWQNGTPGARRRLWMMGVSAALVAALVPLPDRVGGHARVEGAQQRVLVAPTDGFIKAAHAHPGDRIRAGQVLADLAEQDLKLERDRWASQVAQHDNGYAAAMTRADRAEAALSLSRLEEAQAQLALIDEQLQRSQLKAPFDGLLVQGDLSQSIGAPVKQGDALLTVASTQRYRVIVEVEEGDIARVTAGQRGSLALSALPWNTLDLEVTRITPLGQERDGRQVFEVEAAFAHRPAADVRPGLTGQARLHAGYRPLLWSMARPLVNRLRMLWWSL